MALPQTSHRRADVTFYGVFLIGMGLLSYYDAWWPGILIVIGVALCLRQYLRGRLYDVALSAAVFGGLFLASMVDFSEHYVLPVILTVAGIFLLFREYFVPKDRSGEEAVEDTKQEIDDAEHHR